MIEENETANDTQDADAGQDNISPRGLGGIFIAAAWAFVCLLVVAIFWPNLPQRMAFFTGNLFNLIIAFAVIAQVVIYRKQWRVMELQTEYANRAYVCLPAGNMKIFTEIETGNDWLAFEFRLENTGNTPANNVHVCGSTGIAENVPDPSLTVGNKHERDVGLIAPKAHVLQWFKEPVLTSEENRRWVQGELKIYCSGVITYYSFGKVRTTKFCFLKKLASMNLESCGKWNDAD